MNRSQNGNGIQQVIPVGAKLLALKQGEKRCRNGCMAYTVKIIMVKGTVNKPITVPIGGVVASALNLSVNELGQITSRWTGDELIQRLSERLYGTETAVKNARMGVQ